MLNKRIVIVGATSTIAEHCARLWLLEQPTEIILIGRNLSKINTIANDLAIKGEQTRISTFTLDCTNCAAIADLIKQIGATGPIDLALIAIGTLGDQATSQNDLIQCYNALLVNAIAPVLFAETIINTMITAKHGTLGIIGSVAGDRGRKSNYLYGAAKGLLERYVEGLQHRVAQSTITVSLIKPGPTATAMTAHLSNARTDLAPVTTVANEIVRGLKKGKPIIYTPAKWAMIMFIIRNLPRFIFNKLNI